MVFSVQVETCKTAGADFPKKTCPLTGIYYSTLVAGSDRRGDGFNPGINVSGGYLLIYVFACLLCVLNMSE